MELRNFGHSFSTMIIFMNCGTFREPLGRLGLCLQRRLEYVRNGYAVSGSNQVGQSAAERVRVGRRVLVVLVRPSGQPRPGPPTILIR